MKSLPKPTATQTQIKPITQWPQWPTELTTPAAVEEPPSRSRAGAALQELTPRSRAHLPLNRPPPRSRAPTPQASLHIAQGYRPLKRVSASLEASLNSWRLTCFPNPDIKCSNTSRVPKSKVNPRHADLLTPLGNLTPALFEQLATVQPSLVLYTGCAGWPVSFLGVVPPAPVPPPRRTPQKGTAAPSRSVRPPTQRPSRMMP
jgi:hypothetical protein